MSARPARQFRTYGTSNGRSLLGSFRNRARSEQCWCTRASPHPADFTTGRLGSGRSTTAGT
jgi:hypothetical protein